VTRVLVVDDQPVFREAIMMLLGMLPGIEVVGAAVDGADALRLVAEHQPHVVLMDLQMPRMDGAEATRHIRAAHPAVKVLVFTTYIDDDTLIKQALRAGAHGHLTKDAGGENILRAITQTRAEMPTASGFAD
jgi:DNA-binding NarL/FixJ family response regulator